MTAINQYLTETAARRASDLHIKAFQKPFFRISGELTESSFPVLRPEDLAAMVKELLPPHMVKIYQETHEADFSYFIEGVGRFRVNIFQSQGAAAMVFRHVKSKILSVAELHLPPILEKITLAERGIVFMAGTTGSGKSTTLAAMLQFLNETERRRVITIEDPIEYQFTDKLSVITQREIGLDTLTFHTALKHILRQDPDVIIIGEMRDEMSFRTALSAAETGHLVFSTMHAGTAAAAVLRALQFAPTTEFDQARLLLANNLHAIICQRLLRGMQGGVYPAVEILLNTPTVRKLIEKDKMDMLPAAIETGGEDGMQTFNQSIYTLIKSGCVTEEEGMAYATNPAALRMNLQGIFLDEGKRILSS